VTPNWAAVGLPRQTRTASASTTATASVLLGFSGHRPATRSARSGATLPLASGAVEPKARSRLGLQRLAQRRCRPLHRTQRHPDPCSRNRFWAHHITVAAVPPEAGEDAGGGRGGADGAVAPVGLGDAADCRGVGVQPEHGETLSSGAPRSSAGAKIAIRLTSGCRACCTSMGR
jgi:hypothetical protein